MAFFEGCPVEWGGGVPTGRPRALVAGEGWGGQGLLGGARARGGSKGFGSGGG